MNKGEDVDHGMAFQLGIAMWRIDFVEHNPDASDDFRNDARVAAGSSIMKRGLTVLRHLERHGYTVTSVSST